MARERQGKSRVKPSGKNTGGKKPFDKKKSFDGKKSFDPKKATDGKKTFQGKKSNDKNKSSEEREAVEGKKPFDGKKPIYRKRAATKPKSPSNPNEIRLNKYIANSGICSRREADMHISIGSVTVNGKVVTEMGYKVLLNDEVRFDGRVISPEKIEYILLNKPKGFLVTTKDEKDRKTVMDLVAMATKSRIVPVGRLERQTTGLLLFTNDGELARRLTDPHERVRKIYHVELDKNLTQTDFNKIKDGVNIRGEVHKVDEISWIQGATKREVGIKLSSGSNGLVKAIFEYLSYTVARLDRVVFAGLTKKDLPRSNWRHLTAQEIVNLKNS
ncbi:Ribosomal large subunit pseudouridine synthase B [Kordia antarctica]|uniref:Ribosomal large subunit pseudouridine synthase B n=1 Tax=Kordia antarctica TaxID=1218801 RepID=A0A7L4ZKL6_9FLAO|nr:pseudouridine synthase [Kordia antarctica]QHI37060.1 Ribosomal large subunit pseudouridine synthase B [Kordia antarctica]